MGLIIISVDQIQLGKYNPKRSVSLSSDIHQVAGSCARLQEMLVAVMQYVDDVIVSGLIILGIKPAANLVTF